MKRNLLTAGLLLLFSASVMALDSYIGVGYNWSKVAYESQQRKFEIGRTYRGFQGTLGFNFSEDFALDVGAHKITSKKEQVEKMRILNLSVDALFFHPFIDKSRIFGGLGVGSSRVNYKTVEITKTGSLTSACQQSTNKEFKYSTVKPRLVLGLDLPVADSFSLRAKCSLEGLDRAKRQASYKYNSIWNTNLGLIYSF